MPVYIASLFIIRLTPSYPTINKAQSSKLNLIALLDLTYMSPSVGHKDLPEEEDISDI